MSNITKIFEFLDHPADIKIRVFGNNLAELFVNAAKGMMSFLYDSKKKVRAEVIDKIAVEIEADSLESLLVNWLSEVLWLSDTKHCICLDYKIDDFQANKISATISFTQAIPKDDIKAVTYHELKIKKTGKIWVAEVVFDI